MINFSSIILFLMPTITMPLINQLIKHYSTHRSLIIGPVVAIFTILNFNSKSKTEIISNPAVTIQSTMIGLVIWLISITFLHIMQTGSLVSALLFAFMNITCLNINESLILPFAVIMFLFFQGIAHIYLTEVNGVNCFDEAEISALICDAPHITFFIYAAIPIFYILLHKKKISVFLASAAILIASLIDFCRHALYLEKICIDFSFCAIYLATIAGILGCTICFKCYKTVKGNLLGSLAIFTDHVLYLSVSDNIIHKRLIETYLTPLYFFAIIPCVIMIVLKYIDLMHNNQTRRNFESINFNTDDGLNTNNIIRINTNLYGVSADNNGPNNAANFFIIEDTDSNAAGYSTQYIFNEDVQRENIEDVQRENIEEENEESQL